MTRVRVVDSYFDVRRFEALISNEGIIREKKIEKKRAVKFFEKLLSIVFVAMIIVVIVAFFVNIYFVIKTTYQGVKINELTNVCEELSSRRNDIINSLTANGTYENVRKKAYADFNMIVPEESSIIYFEK